MDNKELLALIGISVSIILGVINLYILIKNRRNPIREHLYKEQMAFFIRLNKEFISISLLIDNLKAEVPRKLELTQDVIDFIDSKSQEIRNMVTQHDFIIPNAVYNSTYMLFTQIGDFTCSLMTCDEKAIKIEYDKYSESYYNFIEDLRVIMGIDKLSQENMNLFR
ncbi:MAG TPA: hypothetical protein PLD02_03795 [Saprospiraceae bacterium]|nr:hypothetical protein [Saprospiraceae bacterium]